jgi:hypothetical protein
MPRLAGVSLMLFGAFTFAIGLNADRVPWMASGVIVTVAGSLMLMTIIRSRRIILAALTLAAVIGCIAQVQGIQSVNLAPTLIAWAVWVVGWFALGSLGTNSRPA